MKPISELINHQAKNFGIEQSKESKIQPEQVTARLFAKFALKYGHKFMSVYTDVDVQIEAERDWGRELAGFTVDDIKRGLDKCVDDHPSWPPTVGEFKKLCMVSAEDIGLPSVNQAWAEIATGGQKDFHTQKSKPYSHGIILAARNDPGADIFNWKLLPMDRGLKLFAPIYNLYVKRAMQGEEFTLPIMIEDKKDKAITPDERKAVIAKHSSDLHKALKGNYVQPIKRK